MDNQHDDTTLDQIAIIGLSGRFPGANTVDELWSNLANGVESVATFTDEELLASGVKPEQFNSPKFVRAGSVLDNIEQFDAGFFNFTPREAQITDPQHRILLECSHEALENGGYVASNYDGTIGIYAGVQTSSYYLNNLHPQPDFLANYAPLQITISTEKGFAATKVAYKLGLTGPAVNVDTACSTSLVAVHQACKALLGYECDMALAGGACINVPQKVGHMFFEGGIATPDGHCRTFDANAQGTLRGAGAGVVLLKRLQDAITEGDNIYAVIRGSAINNDGFEKLGFTAPSIMGQSSVVSSALAFADIDAATIGYVETHGTGTPLGDPIEVEALTEAFREDTNATGYCALSSLKTNMGHLDMAAGVAGLIKATMALKHGKIPANLHFENPNPEIDFANSPFYVNTELADWQLKGDHPRRAGVSAFGIGGTNAHVVLEAAPVVEAQASTVAHHILKISAKSKTSLQKQQLKLAEFFSDNPSINLADVAFTLNCGRTDYECRRYIVCSDVADAIEQLKEGGDALSSVSVGSDSKEPNLVMMFPGQGTSYRDTTAKLYLCEPAYRESVDQCATLLQPLLDFDIRYLLFSNVSIFGGHEGGIDPKLIAQASTTVYAQPALFLIEYSLAKLWASFGIKPSAMIGHSVGEYVAACLAEVFSLQDALRLICARGRLMQSMEPGDMLAIRLSEAKVTEILNELTTNEVVLAAVNGPEQCVVSGSNPAIEALAQKLKQDQVSCIRLNTSHGFHSPMMQPMIEDFKAIVQSLSLSAPTCAYISNISGDWITPSEAVDPDYWCQHVLKTVRFSDGISTLLSDLNCIFLEVGPGHQLVNFCRRNSEALAHPAIATLQNPLDSAKANINFHDALGKLWQAYKPLNWHNIYANEKRTKVPLPTYQYDYQRHWVDAPVNDLPVNTTMMIDDTSPTAEQVQCEADDEDANIHWHATGASAYGPEEQKYIDIWTGLLGIEGIGVDNNFFELGGDSLMVTQLISRTRKDLGVELSVQDLYDYPTIKQLTKMCLVEPQEIAHNNGLIPLRDKNAPLPLSFSQQRLWFLQKMDPDSVLYSMPEFLHMKGKLDVDALQCAMQSIVDRHESLRTRFIEADDFCVQRISEGVVMEIDRVYCSHSQLKQQLRSKADLPFDLSTAPLVRATLFTLAENEHVFFINMHHVISDGWSMGILVAEIMSLYNRYMGIEVDALPDLPIQYGDFSAWQQANWDAGKCEHQLDYWKAHLKGSPDILNLPSDFVRPTVQTYNGKMELFTVGSETHQRLKAFSLEHNVSMFMTLLASFNVLLARYSEQTDIAIGSPIANRQHPDLENLIGFFVNTLVMRNQVPMSGSFVELLATVKTNTLAAHANQDVPFEQLVQALQPVREQSHAPLIQVAFILQNTPMSTIQLPDLQVSLGEPLNQHAKYDLLMSLEESEEGIKGQLTYNVDLFAQPRIQNMIKHFEVLLEAILAEPAKPVSQLDMLTAADKQFVKQPHSNAVPSTQFVSIVDLHDHYANLHPFHSAIFEENEIKGQLSNELNGQLSNELNCQLSNELNYKTMQNRANKVANDLIGRGVGADDFVGIVQQRTTDFIITLMGVLKAGAAYVPIEPQWPTDRIAHIVKDAGIGVIITAEDTESFDKSAFEATLDVLTIESIYANDSLSKENPAITINQDQLAYMIYTSGSTGVPKGVCISHRAIANYVKGVQQRIKFAQGYEYLALSTVAADLGYTAIFGALCHGGTLRIVSHDTALDETLLAQSLKQRPVEVLKIVPSHLQALLAGDDRAILPTKCLVLGGEALDEALISRVRSLSPGLRIINHYGPTESTVGVTSFELVGELQGQPPIGKPFDNIKSYILDSQGNQVPVGIPGELYLGGESLARGYNNDAAKTAESFVPDPFSDEAGARLYRTGDLCQYLADGSIKYIKRNDSQVKVRGYRVELEDIRNVLSEHEEIESAVVVHYNDDHLGDVLVAWYVSAWGEEIDSEELADFVGLQLPKYMVPFAFNCLDEIPLNSNGKVNRKALPDPQLASAQCGEIVLPQTELEQSLADIWQELLNIDQVCVETSFAALGGHSLLAIRLTTRVRTQLSLELPLKLIFDMPTIKEQAAYLNTISQLHANSAPELESADREEFSF